MIPSHQCDQPQCDFDGLQCSNAYYFPGDEQCSNFFVTCTSGQLSPPMKVGENRACYHGRAVLARDCSSFVDPTRCQFTGIRCVNAEGLITENEESTQYVVCENGVISSPLEVPTHSVCYNHVFIAQSNVDCDPERERCQPGLFECVNAFGTVVENECSQFGRSCVNGVTSAPVAIVEGYSCYNRALIPSTLCPGYDMKSCSFCSPRCVTKEGVATFTECTEDYVTCVDGIVSSPQQVGAGYSCFRGSLIPSSFCPLDPIYLLGVTGPTGPMGLTGPQGMTGERGPTGPMGAMGATGPTGEEGPSGEPGPTGAPGERGPRGPQGPSGAPGLQGEAGIPGEMGPTGEDGPSGEPGPMGATGPQGARGEQGERGPIGPQGPTGIQGVTGPIGPQGPASTVTGPTGEVGPQGPQGPMGETGPQGQQGPTGPMGEMGATGVQGPTGPIGATGATGEAGPIEGTTGFSIMQAEMQFLLGTRVSSHLLQNDTSVFISTQQNPLTIFANLPIAIE